MHVEGLHNFFQRNIKNTKCGFIIKSPDVYSIIVCNCDEKGKVRNEAKKQLCDGEFKNIFPISRVIFSVILRSCIVGWTHRRHLWIRPNRFRVSESSSGSYPWLRKLSCIDPKWIQIDPFSTYSLHCIKIYIQNIQGVLNICRHWFESKSKMT
jgi:hypothetical protein